VVLVIVGIAILGLGVHLWRSSAEPINGVTVQGTVVSVERRRSRRSGSGTVLYGPTIRYFSPSTGQAVDLPPSSMRPEVYEEGQSVELILDPVGGRAVLPERNRVSKLMLPFAGGLGCLALGIYDLLG
jgi:hypothetical protein